MPIADVSVFSRIQREVQHDKKFFLQITQMEAEQAQNGPAVVLSLPRLIMIHPHPWIATLKNQDLWLVSSGLVSVGLSSIIAEENLKIRCEGDSVGAFLAAAVPK